MLGDNLYKLANIVYNKTGIKPYALTNGKALTREIMEKSANSNISSYVVSLENPFAPAVGAIPVEESIKRILNLNNEEVKIYPGVVVITNDMFKKIPEISDYFYEHIGMIPTMSELNFDYFVVPSDKQLDELYNGIYCVVKKYWNKTQLKLFPYIVPALNNLDVRNEWLVEFNISNSLNITEDFEKSFQNLERKLNSSFPIKDCKACELEEDCYRVKWLWKLSDEREEAYCKMKKAIVNAFYDAMSS